jgi:hypothetical protein
MALVVLAVSACIPQRFVGFSSATYVQEQNWLCRPGAAAPNTCVGSFLDSTIVNADGSTQLDPFHGYDQSKPAAPIDCFYVYPTVSSPQGGLNDLEMANDPTSEIAIVQEQAARFTSVCNVYAPLYRQMKFDAYFAAADAYKAANDLAYSDVHDAFKHYMANFNSDRPIVLIGHSQGAQHLLRLVQDEFDTDPQFTKKLVSAVLVGWPHFRSVPGDAPGLYATPHIPLCATPTANGCVVAYQSYGANQTPPAGSGNPKQACSNPTSIAGGSGPIKAYISPAGIPGVPRVSTATVELPGTMTASCIVPPTGAPFLAIAATHQPGDVRNVDQLLLGPNSSFGLHLKEVDLTQGNLLELVRSQASGRGITIP